ncbi:hypothetical protein Tco_1508685 [Tanacetum coccineum]
MQEVVLFYNGLDVPTRQILDSRGAIPSKTTADAKIAIQEMADVITSNFLRVKCVKTKGSRVPVPLLEDPYEAVRQAYLDGTDIESEPFEDPVETETLESPLTVSPPTSLPESTPPTLVPILLRTARMVVRVPLTMSSCLSASMAEVAAMSESAFRKRFRSSYESLPSLSLPGLPSRKHYRGAEDEGPTARDRDPATRDESLAAGVKSPDMDDESHGIDDESHGMNDESHCMNDESHGLDDESRGLDEEGHSIESDGLGLEEEEVVPGGQQQAALVVGTAGSGSTLESERPKRVSASRHPTLTTWTDPEDGMVYIDVPAYPPPVPPVQTPPSPE